MSYRDDLGAAQARAEAAERRAAALQKRVDELEGAASARRQDGAFAMKQGIARVPIPERFDVLLDDDRLRVRWRWFRPAQHLMLLLFCIAWDAIVGAFVVSMLLKDGLSWGVLFAVGHVGVGVGLTYSLLAGLFNRTTVSATPGRLTIAHGPIPWRGNRELVRDRIRQLYVTQETTGSDNPTTTYDLSAVLDDDRQVKLVKGLEQLEQARYLEHAFELHLAIKNVRVPDEAPKR